MFGKIRSYLSNNAFELAVGGCIILIIVLSLYSHLTGKKGTWSSKFTYDHRFDLNVGSKGGEKVKNKSVGGESKGEIECRRVLQKLFRKPFNKVRPGFLSNVVTGGNNLEIDCFDDEMRLGVEYSGIQHYKFTPFFHKNKEAFLNQKYRDEMKRRQCLDNGIRLIEVPYTVKFDNIENYLMKELQKYGYLK